MSPRASLCRLLRLPVPIAVAAALAAGAGCAAPHRATVETFRAPPTGWTTTDGAPATLEVEESHLEVGRDVAFLDPTPLGPFVAMVDVAFVGGELPGFAGLVVAELDAPERPYLAIALRPGGSWRTYRSSDPLEPIGGRGWQPAPKDAPAGFTRLGARVVAGAVELSIEGGMVDRQASEGPAPGPRTYRVGIFTKGVVSRWKNFIAGDSDPSDPFRPEAAEFWGDSADAERLLERAVSDVKSFRARPSRMGIHAIVASLEEARRIALGTGDPAARRRAEEIAQKVESVAGPSASRIGEAAFLSQAFARLRVGAVGASSAEAARFLERALAAEKAGDAALALSLLAAAEASGAEPTLGARIAELKARIPPLRLDFVAESEAAEPIVGKSVFWNAARESYGALGQRAEGELRIRAVVGRSSNEPSARQTERKVRVVGAGAGKLSGLLEEREKLAGEAADELLEAQARANILRAAAKLGDGAPGAGLKRVRIEGRDRELLQDDADKLAAWHRRLGELDGLIEAEEARRPAQYRTVPATLHTSSLSTVFSVTVDLDGRRLVDLKDERVYRGVEQWEHAARPDLGLSASRFREEVVREATAVVSDRVASRFRAAISPESLVSKLPAEARLGFALRYARATGSGEARTLLEWILQEELGIGPGLRKGVADLCLE